MSADRRPTSTYRLQVTADFDLYAAARQLPYLHDLGVDWVYLSPILEAEPGSTHGYDVVAPQRIDPARGGTEGLAAVSAEARRLGMGVLVDIVPNHVGVATPERNPWWWDLLTHGRDSAYAEFFDVDWAFGGDKVRIPVLGDDDLPGDGRPTGHLEVVPVGDGHELRYHDHRFPVAPGTGDGSADEVHARQHYELIGWRRADGELNYRRFFSVNTLAGVRVELPEVFGATHVEVRRWFEEDLVDGLRIDHPDGLRDPEGYLDLLCGLTAGAYTLVEKILEPGEELPRGWAMDGTTGYDALVLLDRVLTDPAGREALEAVENGARGHEVDWAALVLERKRAVASGTLLAETRRILRELPDLLPATWEQLEEAVAEVLAGFPVYRSYLPLGREHLEEALASAHAHRPDLGEALDEIAPLLADGERPVAKRFQQTSGMVMAKGVEDCSFYRWSRLTSLNEVGGDPSVFSATPQEFHAAMTTRQRDWPRAMTALSTHDTKRGEDTRARITALAEDPATWATAFERLQSLAPMPDAGLANLVWQAALGAWPLDRERLQAYAEKAMREAGEHTSWTDPDEAFESAVHAAVDAAYDDAEVTRTLEQVVAHFSAAGDANSLSLKLLALTVPGVPDVYQGSELEERSLVDPDNRRPVDYERLAAVLADGSVPKVEVTRTALHLRRDRPELFTGYTPLLASGPAADHVLAFDRGGAVTVATRLPLGLARDGWGETTLALPDGSWVDQLSGRTFSGEARVSDLLADLPVALVVKEER